MTGREREIARLYRGRPKSPALRWTAVALGALAAYAWFLGGIDVAGFFTTDRAAAVNRFLGEIRPWPLRGRAWDWGVFGSWAGTLLDERGLEGLWVTLAISVLAIVLAGLWGLGLGIPAARTLMRREPFASGPAGAGWRATVHLFRFLQLCLRSIPEFIWAFLLLMMFGTSAWPAVLALALHNAGILGKLDSETIENLEPDRLRSLRALGATRAQIIATAVAPLGLPRFLLYFFYRFETCVREATILGLLGIVSLGYWIQDARARLFYDEMVFLVLLGSAIVIAADLVSGVCRRVVRRAA